MTSPRIPVTDWLVTETVRLHEEQWGRLADQAATEAARAAPGTLAHRLVARALALPGARELRQSARHWLELAAIAAAVLILLAGAAGFGAARGSVTGREVNILLSLVTLLGLPLAMLLLWIVFTLARPWQGAGSGIIGSVIGAAMHQLSQRTSSEQPASRLLLAGAGLLATRSGYWLLGATSHALWLVYALVALGTLTVFFSVVEYDLVWGTTILGEQTGVRIVSLVAALPVALGLLPPLDPETILAARSGASAGEVRGPMARLVAASIVAWAILPRALLLLFCLAMTALALRRLTLDTHQPGYLRLAPGLEPVSPPARQLGDPPADGPAGRRRRQHPGAGPPVLVGIELERRHEEGVPRIPGIEATVLGQASDRAGREAVKAILAELRPPPAALVAVCSLLRTPDAGTAGLLTRLADAADAPLVLVLDELQELEDRGISVGARLSDWEALGDRVGAPVVMLDSAAPEAAAIGMVKQYLEHGV